MRSIQFFISVFIFCSIAFPQDATKIALIRENSYDLIEAENQTGTLYISLLDLVHALSINVKEEDNTNFVSLQFGDNSIQFSVNNPFVNIVNHNDSSFKTIQLSSTPYRKGNKIFVSVISIVDLVNLYWDKELLLLAANRIKVVEKIKATQLEQNSIVQISSFSVESGDNNCTVKIKTNKPIVNPYNFYRAQKLHLILWGTSIKNDSILYPLSDEIIEKIEIIKSARIY